MVPIKIRPLNEATSHFTGPEAMPFPSLVTILFASLFCHWSQSAIQLKLVSNSGRGSDEAQTKAPSEQAAEISLFGEKGNSIMTQSPCWQRGNTTHLRQSQSVVPVMPRALVEHADFRLLDDPAKTFISNAVY